MNLCFQTPGKASFKVKEGYRRSPRLFLVRLFLLPNKHSLYSCHPTKIALRVC